jgi:potassium voltage-gated channel Shab-related subfamily B protein 2
VRSASQSTFRRIEVFCIIFFTIEYGARLLTSPEPHRFVRSLGNVADVAAILPYYVELGLRAHSGDGGGSGADLGNARLVRIVRLVRVFRLLRLGKRSDKLRVVVSAIQESTDMLTVLLFLLCLATVIFSTLMYYAEEGLTAPHRQGTAVHGATFPSIPAAFWWCIVTLMTVGYGDVVPVSNEGKLVAGITMVAAFIILALPISVIGANFTQQWIVYKETTLLHRRTGTLGAEFSELEAELAVHTGVLDELVDAATHRGAAMDARARRLRRVAAAAGVGQEGSHAGGGEGEEAERRADGGGADCDADADAEDADVEEVMALRRHSASPPPTPRASRSSGVAGDDGGEGGSPASPPSPPSPPSAPLPPTASKRSLLPRCALSDAEAELESLLDALSRDADAARETFAMAELISSEDFLTRMDAAMTKHHRLAVMDRKGGEACAAVQALLGALAAERAARPSLVMTAASTHMPSLAAAAAAAAALLAERGGSVHGGSVQGGGGERGGSGRGGGERRLSRTSGGSGRMAGKLSRANSGAAMDPVSLATRASREALDKLAAARRT